MSNCRLWALAGVPEIWGRGCPAPWNMDVTEPREICFSQLSVIAASYMTVALIFVHITYYIHIIFTLHPSENNVIRIRQQLFKLSRWQTDRQTPVKHAHVGGSNYYQLWLLADNQKRRSSTYFDTAAAAATATTSTATTTTAATNTTATTTTTITTTTTSLSAGDQCGLSRFPEVFQRTFEDYWCEILYSLMPFLPPNQQRHTTLQARRQLKIVYKWYRQQSPITA